jgi:hypothetical protein
MRTTVTKEVARSNMTEYATLEGGGSQASFEELFVLHPAPNSSYISMLQKDE